MSNQYPGGVISKTPVVPTSLSAPGIWTLSQQAAAQATNTWPFPRDPQFNYVTMLLHGDGSGGPTALGMGAGASSTVTAFNTDASTNNFNVTINGDARSNNFTPYQGDGYYSNYFDGSGDYLTVPDNAVLDMGSSDFTIEGWVFLSSTGSSQTFVAKGTGAGNQASYHIVFNGTNWLYYLSGNGSTWSIASGVTMGAGTANTWQHLALVRSGSTFTPYVNGTAGTTTSSATALFDSTNVFSIGADDATNQRITGYISNCRVVKGTAVYTSAFTPSTTPLTAITNTQLLTCQSNRFIDNSSNAFTVTKAGDTAVAPAQPFTLPSSVATYGCGYFDGSGDYLTVADNVALELLASDFTIECWVYPTGGSGAVRDLISKRSAGANYGGYSLYLDTSNNCGFVADNDTSAPWPVAITGTTVSLSQWTHLAVTRSGSTWTLWKNGVSVGTATSSITINDAAASVGVGAIANGDQPFTGYITDARILKGTALYTSAFTPPTTPLTAVSGTSLLTTQYNGAGNNNGFKDSSQNNFVITRNGNTTQGTFTPYGSNWSNYFSSNSGLTAPNNSAFKPATNDFTVEAWIFSTSTGQQIIYGDSDSATNNGVLDLYLTASGFLASDYWTSSTAVTTRTSTLSPTINQWNHVLVSRTGTTMYIGLNGVLQSFTAPSSYQSPATIYPTVGRLGAYAAGVGFIGYISNFRYINGTNLYSGSTYTVPTTPLTAITNTVLLTSQSNCFIDNSTNAFALTVNGSPSVQRFSPFAPLTVYNPSVNGGSGYFDGSGDYLSVASQTALGMGAGDFTYEAWIYVNEVVPTNALRGLFDSRVSGATGCGIYTSADTGTTSKLVYTTNSAIAASSTNTIKAYAWTHVAVTRSGTTVRGFLNGALEFTYTDSRTFSSSAGTYIGADVTPAYFNGFINDARILKGTAQYTSAFTPPTAPLTAITNTSLLLSYTNAGILDNAMMNDLETRGNAQISTSVVKYGTASMYFDGSGDWVSAISSPNYGYGTGDFTIEFWVYPTSSAGTQVLLDQRAGTSTRVAPTIYTSASVVYYYVNGNNRISGTSPSLNQWSHFAISRSGTSTKMFINGTQIGSTYTDTFDYVASPVRIGDGNDGAGPYPYSGYIDDLRITKGVARYTTTFTPPTAAFPNG